MQDDMQDGFSFIPLQAAPLLALKKATDGIRNRATKSHFSPYFQGFGAYFSPFILHFLPLFKALFCAVWLLVTK